MNFPFIENIDSIDRTKAIAADFSKIIKAGDIVLLNGNLGTGKTTFVKFMCKNIGINNANSPSFSIVNEYVGNKKIYHFDFYRLKSIAELYDIGFDEYLNDSDAIIFIEWAELFPEILPKKYFEIKIKFEGEEKRIIKISKT